jgi:hypothetical protein
VSLHDDLQALTVAWPEEPDVTAAVRARLRPRPRRRWLAIPAVVVLLVAAVPPARSTVLDWLGIGGETIERVPRQPTTAPSPLDLGTRIPLPRDALIPAALGRPAAAYEDGAILTLRYPRALLSEFPGHTNERYVHKLAGPDTRVEAVTVDGEPGFWISGAAHSVLFEDPSGRIIEARGRLAGNALVWRRGDRTLRLEADIPKARALAIARSIP